MLIFEKSYNSLVIINMTKYIHVNNKTSFIYVISRNYQPTKNLKTVLEILYDIYWS